MPDLRGLTIIVAGADAERFRAALTLACAAAALGGRTRIYLHDAAVALLADAGAIDLRATAHDLNVELIACQTGLAAAGLAVDTLTPPVAAGGMVGLLADLGEDRLVVV